MKNLRNSKYSGATPFNLNSFSLRDLQEIGNLLIGFGGGGCRDLSCPVCYPRRFTSETSKEKLIDLIKEEMLKDMEGRVRKAIGVKSKKESSTKRLMKDLKEINSSPLKTIYAVPIKGNLYEWHCNLLAPKSSKYHGGVFHLIFNFPIDYPFSPPKVSLCSEITHSHVLESWGGASKWGICLDLLQTHESNERFSGWSTLQAFLLEEEEEKSNVRIKNDIANSVRFVCRKCGHAPKKGNPFPWPSHWDSPEKALKIRSSCLGTSGVKKQVKKEVILPETAKSEELKGLERDLKTLLHRRSLCSNPKSKRNVMKLIKKQKTRIKRVKGPLTQLYVENLRMGSNIQVSITDLPVELLLEIFQWLQREEVVVVAGVCDEWASLSLHPVLWEKREIQCFHSKCTFEEDVIGVGVNVQYSRSTGKILKVTTPLDLLSFASFDKEFVRKSAWNVPFTHFCPLYITDTHWSKAEPLFKKLVSELYNKTFNPIYAVDLICKFMNSMIVVIMSDEVHASELAIQGYAYFHRLLLHYVRKYPLVMKQIDFVSRRFIENDVFRHKDHVPSLGEFFPLLAVSRFPWAVLRESVMMESFTRRCFWVEKSLGRDLRKVSSDSESASSVLELVFRESLVSLRLVALNVEFLRGVTSEVHNGERVQVKDLKGFAQVYDERFGTTPDVLRKSLQESMFRIKKISNFGEFFRFIGWKGDMSQDLKMLGFLKHAWQLSVDKGYFSGPPNRYAPIRYNLSVDFKKGRGKRTIGKMPVNNYAMVKKRSTFHVQKRENLQVQRRRGKYKTSKGRRKKVTRRR